MSYRFYKGFIPDSWGFIMATELASPSPDLPHRRMWVGTAGASVAWTALGVIDVLINWRACQHQFDFGLPPPQTGARILIGAVGALLFFVSLLCGWISYRNWREVTRERNLLATLAVDRPEYMAYVGLIVTTAMSMGTFWLALTPIFTNICWRAR